VPVYTVFSVVIVVVIIIIRVIVPSLPEKAKRAMNQKEGKAHQPPKKVEDLDQARLLYWRSHAPRRDSEERAND
jgi:hypothetical protein